MWVPPGPGTCPDSTSSSSQVQAPEGWGPAAREHSTEGAGPSGALQMGEARQEPSRRASELCVAFGLLPEVETQTSEENQGVTWGRRDVTGAAPPRLGSGRDGRPRAEHVSRD